MTIRELLSESQRLEEGKIRNIAAVLMLASTLAHSNPTIAQITGNQWKSDTREQKIEYVKDLAKITSVENLPSYISVNPSELRSPKLNSNLITMKLDSFYINKEHNSIPVWLAFHYLQGNITETQMQIVADRIMSEVQGVQWIDSEEDDK